MNNLVIKHNSLIKAKGKTRYNKNELKLICNLVSKIKPSDSNLETKSISLKELGFVLENTKNHNQYDRYFEELLSKPFKLPKEFGSYWVNWFSALKYENGVIEYAFDERLKPFLLKLKDNFTQYKLYNILNLSSSYSIHIYELLKHLETAKNTTIKLKDLREILNIPNSYNNADIKRLLNNTQTDLQKNTDISFNFTFNKQGRSFYSINFFISKNISKQPKLFNVDESTKQEKEVNIADVINACEEYIEEQKRYYKNEEEKRKLVEYLTARESEFLDFVEKENKLYRDYKISFGRHIENYEKYN